jgi:hypothetical protein
MVGWARWGWGAWLGGARLRQVGSAAGARYRVGLGSRCVSEARWGRVGVGRGGAWLVGHDQGRATVAGAWGVGSRDGRCVSSKQRGAEEWGEQGRMKKQAGFTNWALMFLGRAKEHKLLCYSEI